MDEEHGHLDGKPQNSARKIQNWTFGAYSTCMRASMSYVPQTWCRVRIPTSSSRLPVKLNKTNLIAAWVRWGPPQNAIMQYVGIIVISQKKKKRKASRAVNTPVTAPSTRRMSIMKAFTFVAMLRQEPSTHKGTKTW